MPDDLDRIVQKLHSKPADADAWTDLVQALWPYVVTVATRALGRNRITVDVEDIAQEAFLSLAETGMRLLEPTSDSLRRFLASVVHHRVVDQIRHVHSQRRDKRRNQSLTSSGDVATNVPSPDAAMEASETLLQLQQSLAMDDLDRKIIRCLLNGESPAEIARNSGKHASTVSRRLVRLQSLFEALTDRDLTE